MTEFDGILTEEEQEILNGNEVYDVNELSKLSFRKLSGLVGEDAAREIEDKLIERKGLTLKNSTRKSLKTG